MAESLHEQQEGSANVRAGLEEAVPEDAEPPESRPFVRPRLPVSGFAAEDAPGNPLESTHLPCNV